MDRRPIGFFDSGLGGLTCIPYVMKALPDERVIYFGDTARTPYGSKAESTIRSFSLEIADFLVENGAKMIVIACNTVSATCLGDLRARHPGVPMLGIIGPAARAVAGRCGPENRIGIIGTKATIRSGAYSHEILGLNGALDISQAACPALVPLIEEGIIQHEIMDLSIKYYLDHFLSYNGIDTLVLGCTHYPLIRGNIQRLYPSLDIVDPSEEILSSIDGVLADMGMRAGKRPTGEADAGRGARGPDHVFYASDLSENFVNMINRILGPADFNAAFRSIRL
ncbi:MAG: glutamate racemase [Clostridiales Family XIII bacterium]|jgi:glutamate racemase|nr:glutamate racemase [Clostridiales Family XIII bacterium]